MRWIGSFIEWRRIYLRLNARIMTNKMPIFVRFCDTCEVNAFQSHVYVCRYNLSCLCCLLASFACSLSCSCSLNPITLIRVSEIVWAGFFSALTCFCVTFDWIVLLRAANRLWNKIISRLCTQINGVNQPHIITYEHTTVTATSEKRNFVNQFSISKRDFRSYWNVSAAAARRSTKTKNSKKMLTTCKC